MVSAIDPSRRAWLRAFGLTFVVAATLVQSGCARLLAFRSPNFPAADSSVASRDSTKGRTAASGDLYAERMSRRADLGDASDRTQFADRTRPQAGTDVAANSSPSSPERTQSDPAGSADRRAGGSGVGADSRSIALQAPVTLPAFSASPGPGTESSAAVEPEGRKVAATATRPAAAVTAADAAASKAESELASLERILGASRQALDALSTYQVRMNHQERVNNRLNPAEDVLLSIRRQPKAVRIEWIEGSNKGREVLYAANTRGGQMHVKMAGAIALPRLSMSPDSPMARRNSRHPIYEAGFDTIIDNMQDGLTKVRTGEPAAGRMAYAGQEVPEGLSTPCHKITRVMPTGNTWLVYIDPQSNLPVFVQESAPNGELLERYIFTNPNLNMADLERPEAFDPDARWGEAKGLFSRLARGAAGNDDATNKAR